LRDSLLQNTEKRCPLGIEGLITAPRAANPVPNELRRERNILSIGPGSILDETGS
jgi:hypothetical protein